MLGVPVDQVDLLGVDVLQGLLVDAVAVHVLVVWLVYVPLFPDERRVTVFLHGCQGNSTNQNEGKKCKRGLGRASRSTSAHSRGMGWF